MKYRILFILCSVNIVFAGTSIMPITQHKDYVRLGDTTVVIKQFQRTATSKSKNFVHVHQNETTALSAALITIRENGGSVLTLQHPGGRNIVFHLQKKRYEFDPNRIFTDIGIKKTLTTFGNYSLKAHAAVKVLANKILNSLPQHGKIIAVHNNESYSLHNYLPGHANAHDARKIHIDTQHYYRNFYLVTQKWDFLRLKKLHFNSVLQAKLAPDDGSLSVYLAARDYVNVEAGYDQLKAQIHMLHYA